VSLVASAEATAEFSATIPGISMGVTLDVGLGAAYHGDSNTITTTGVWNPGKYLNLPTVVLGGCQPTITAQLELTVGLTLEYLLDLSMSLTAGMHYGLQYPTPASGSFTTIGGNLIDTSSTCPCAAGNFWAYGESFFSHDLAIKVSVPKTRIFAKYTYNLWAFNALPVLSTCAKLTRDMVIALGTCNLGNWAYARGGTFGDSTCKGSFTPEAYQLGTCLALGVNSFQLVCSPDGSQGTVRTFSAPGCGGMENDIHVTYEQCYLATGTANPGYHTLTCSCS
jgi:hypothetical protein